MSATHEANDPVGRYALSRRLATGGMAEVWLARDVGSTAGRVVVLKMLLPELCDDVDFVKMFLDEARLASVLNHPNIVNVFDLGQLDRRYFIAMEYVAGKTLRQVVQRLRSDNRRLPVWFALLVAIKTCEALESAHSACDDEGWPLCIVHRDVTPENVMVGYDGSIKVLDFGIAKASTRHTKTRVGVMKGKHAYLAPEQILAAETGCPVDQRADLYSLGVVLYELVTATRPFDADNELALIHTITDVQSKPQPPRALAPWLEPGVERVILRAMAREPSERFDSAAEMRAALVDCLAASGQQPTERHVGGMLSLIFPAAEDSSGIAALADDAAPTEGEPFVVPEADLCDGASNTEASDDGGAGDAERAMPDARLPTPGGAPRTSGVHSIEATSTRAPPSEPSMPSDAASSSGESGRHRWDVVLDRLQTGRRNQRESTPDRQSAASVRSGADARPATARDSAPPTLDPSRQARQYFELGLEHHRNHDTQAALEALQRAVAADPENRLYRSNLRLMTRRARLVDDDGQDES
ncbi:MAG: protein kinase [Polyangiaceae bacterium]|nr:protein kinase [Polyangiaceae bacterium]